MKHNYVMYGLAAAGLLTVVYVVRSIGNIQQAGQAAVKPATDAIWSLWEGIKPYTGTIYSNAGFVLTSKYITAGYKLNSQFMESMKLAHSGNATLLTVLVDPYGVIRPQYRHLIDKEINAKSLGITP